MKKYIVYSVALFLISCGDAKDPEAAKGLELITKSDCFTCHKLTEAFIGPPYSAIAKKYKLINDRSMDSMVTQIIAGGRGRWGNVPMPAHSLISNADAQTMVHYIMSIKE